MAPLPRALPKPRLLPIFTPDPPESAQPAFPRDALGPIMEAAATALADRTQVPFEVAAHHVLTLAAAAAQRFLRIRLPTGERRPVSCYFITLAEADPYCASVRRMVAACVHAVVDRRDGRKAPTTMRFIMDPNLGPNEEPNFTITPPAPDPPKNRRERTGNGPDTWKAVGFATHPDELISVGQRRRQDAARLCRIWDEGGDRDSDGMHPAAPLSLHLTATPRAGETLLRDTALADSGFLARMLVAWPASRIGDRAWAGAEDDAPPPAFAAFTTILDALHERPAAPFRTIVFSEPAKLSYFAFMQEVEAAMAPGGAYETIRPLANHLAEHAARLAAVIALIGDGDLAALEKETLEHGIALARFYAAEALRLAGLGRLTAGIDAASALHIWLERSYAEQEVSLRDICRSGPPAVRDADTAHKIMRKLERLGIVQPMPGEVSDGPRRVRAAYRWRLCAGVNDMSRDVA